jgi:hypothetical protein
MLDRLVERFCEFDDFCQKIRAEWEAISWPMVTRRNASMGRKRDYQEFRARRGG